MLAAALRLVALLDQSPFNDEWHVLAAVDRFDLASLASHFGRADRSIPIALYLETASSWGGIGEAVFWLPFAVGGLLGPLALWWLVRPRVGPRASLVFFAFLACMPLLVFYSRFARPYGIAAPGCVLLVLLLDRWRRAPTPGLGLACALLTSAIGWSLPVYLPFCAGAWGAIALMVGSSDSRATWRQLASCALATAALLALLLAPALRDLPTLAAKTGAGGFRLDSVTQAAAISLGARPDWLLLAWLPLVLLGAVRLVQRARGLALAMAAAALTQLLAILATTPAQIFRALVVARYALPIGLCALLCAAVAVDELRVPRHRVSLGPGLAAALCAIAVSWQPSVSLGPRADNFRSTRIYHRLFFQTDQLEQWFSSPPPVYRELSALPAGSAPIVEVPYNGMLRTPYPYYQLHHGQPVYLGVTRGICGIADDREIPPAGKDGFAFTRFVAIDDLEAMRDVGVRYVVLHRDVESEVPWVRPETRHRHRFDYDACVALLSRLTATQPAVAEGIAHFRLDPEAR